MNQKVFEYKGEYEGVDVYLAKFQLPDDGCPESEQFLQVTVEVNHDCGIEVILHVLGSNGATKHFLTSGPVSGMEAVSRLLYKSARLVTRQFIEPV